MARKLLIVGAGFAGAVVARQAAEAGHFVDILERRTHVGGNAHDEHSPQGVLYHPYGPHLFHTNADRIFDYLSRFTEWKPYEHRVRSWVRGKLVPFPINLTTLEMIYERDFDADSMRQVLDAAKLTVSSIRTSEDLLLSSIGPELTDLFYRGYTRKQWERDLSELKAGVAARIPLRFNCDDRYFEDKHQAMPAHGYHVLFQNLLRHPNITVHTGVAFQRMTSGKYEHVVYTGPIDAYFDFEFGPLPYRSLTFQHDFLPVEGTALPVCTVNFPNDFTFTRITEIKHATGQRVLGTVLTKEYPTADGDPYYPVPSEQSEELYRRYAELADREQGVTFVGRLAQYRYYNMDQAVAAALKASERVLEALT